MNYRRRLAALAAMIGILLISAAGIVIYLDPFFVYHKPVKGFYYVIDNQRSQNEGILEFFDYDAIITGTSLTENFLASEFDSMFGVSTVKVPNSGSTYYEASTAFDIAVESGHDVRICLRSMDLNHLIEDSRALRTDLGEYPAYLRNKTVWDDCRYVLNRDIILKYIFPMLKKRAAGDEGGRTSFDDYCSWRGTDKSGKEYVTEGRTDAFSFPAVQGPLSEAETEIVVRNLEENILRLARSYPDTDFYYFIPPYNVYWWGCRYEEGLAEKYIEAEEIAVREMTEYPNIHLFLFTNWTDLTQDLSYYRDVTHYDSRINSVILNAMKNGECQLTKENRQTLLDQQKLFYEQYDYNRIFSEE